MSYETMNALMADEAFAGRVRACMAQLALDHLDDPVVGRSWLATDVLRGGAVAATVMARLVAVAPGVADGLKMGQGGTVNQGAVADATIAELVSANWQEVGRLAYGASPLAPGQFTTPGLPTPLTTLPPVGTPSASGGFARPLTGP